MVHDACCGNIHMHAVATITMTTSSAFGELLILLACDLSVRMRGTNHTALRLVKGK